MIGGSGTRRGGEELREVFDLGSKGTWDNKGGTWGRDGAWRWDGLDRSLNDGRGKVLNGDVSEGDTDNGAFKLSVGVFVLVLGGPLKDWAVEGF